MTRIAFTIFFFCALSSAFAQSVETYKRQIDSMQSEISLAVDSGEKALLIYQTGQIYAQFNGKIAEKHYKRAIHLAERELSNSKNQELEVARGRMYASLGVTLYLEGNAAKAIPAELKAIEIFESEKATQFLGRSYVVMGAIYKQIQQFSEARKFHFKALEISQEANDSGGMALALNNIGLSYFDEDSFSLAIDYYKKSLAIYTKIGDKRGMGVELINLGNSAQQQKNHKLASSYYHRSLKHRQEIEDRFGLIFSHARVGEILLKADSIEQALVHANKSHELATQFGMVKGLNDAHELLAKVYHKLGNYQKAYEHQVWFMQMKDSLSDAENVKRVADAENQFKFKQEQLADSIKNAEAKKALQTEIEIREIKANQQRIVQVALIVGILITLALVVVSLKRYLDGKKQNQIISAQKAQVEKALITITKRDEEKELLLKEIHHRVKNNLQVVSSLLELQAKRADEDTQTAFADGQSRVKAMALIHEKLYRNEDISTIDFEEYTNQLANQIAALYTDRKVQLEINGNNCQFDIDTAVPLGLMLNELITNAFKYAFKLNGGFLKEEVHPKGDEGYELVVADNGNGMPDDFDLKKAKSLGLRLVNRLSRQLYGKAEYENINGAKFSITFKDTHQRKLVA
ncbi:MAG: tetratricopeptide repeat protein [Bacteroidetes bacterium]|nr:tetratricopeptide repeat protein [Bacteroidota bacterium]